MRRIASIFLLFLVSVPALPAQEGKLEFGKNGYVTRDQLATLSYGPVVKDLALGVHMPKLSAPFGKPLWAYFVVKNTQNKMQDLDMRFDFVTGQTHGLVNSCAFTVKPLTKGVKIGALMEGQSWECRNGMWQCGKPLVYVATKGYYVAALDLAAGGNLRPGDYEVSWRYYQAHVSNTVHFTVLAGAERQRAELKPRQWNVWEVRAKRSKEESKPKQEIQREKWDPVAMEAWYQGCFSAALGSGVGERHVTNLDWLSAGDDLLSISAEWNLGDKIDRVTLRLSAKDPKVGVDVDNIHVYLLADFPGGRPDGGMADRGALKRRLISANPYTIEIHVPSSWRTSPKEEKAAGKFQAAFLITSEPLRQPHWGGAEEGKNVTLVDKNRPRVWEGLLKTSFQDVSPREGAAK